MALNTSFSALESSIGSAKLRLMTQANQDRLNASRIRQGMEPEARAKLRYLTLLAETDSTNAAVLRLPGDQQHAHALLADRQSGGRGRRQRTWHSPAGGNIYLSLGWWFGDPGHPLSTLPLLVAIAVCRALARTGLQGHGIKWPNDILVGDEKLAGILVELQSSGIGPAAVVIGIGLNVRMPPLDKTETGTAIDRPWTDLATQLGSGDAGIGRNRISALLLEELVSALEHFEAVGFEGFRQDWQKLDLLDGNNVELEHLGQTIRGLALGVDDNGGLVVETEGGGARVFHSAEVSMHRG